MGTYLWLFNLLVAMEAMAYWKYMIKVMFTYYFDADYP